MKLRFVLPALALVYLVIPALWGGNNYVMSLLVAAFIIAGVALAWALLANLGGMVSFGHSAFFGVGAYLSALLCINYQLPVLAGILLGGLGAAVVSIAMLPVLRLSGPYFALALLAYASIFKILAMEFKGITGGAAGLTNIPALPIVMGFDFSSKVGVYLVIVTIVLVFTGIYHLIRTSHYGLALKAMHESEDATRVVGVNSTLLKAAMLFVSAFMTGVVGALNVHYINFIDPDYAFDVGWTLLPVVAVVFGGYRTLVGPLVGAVGIFMLDQLVFKAVIGTGHQIMLGAVLAVMVLFSPDGLVPLVTSHWKRARRAQA
jgi:branched-chain amino acid transport system permease protein